MKNIPCGATLVPSVALTISSSGLSGDISTRIDQDQKGQKSRSQTRSAAYPTYCCRSRNDAFSMCTFLHPRPWPDRMSGRDALSILPSGNTFEPECGGQHGQSYLSGDRTGRYIGKGH